METHEIDETLELQSDDCILCPKYCICCGECEDQIDPDAGDEGQPTEYEEWQDVFGGDEDPPTDIDDI
jgi:hypothetical protein